MTRREILVHLLSMVAARIYIIERGYGTDLEQRPEKIQEEFRKLSICEDWLGQELLGINLVEYPEEIG